ncbi:MAG: mechanosensitive ion channel [Deltaproteobacteria bacterium]|nr:mechanosensitive ion channel [Deltaproteobacteria bacterium]
MIEFTCNFLVNQGVNPATANSLAIGILTVLAIVLSIIANFVAKRLILKGLAHIIVRTETKWDDIFLKRKVFDKLSHLAPAVVLYIMMPLALEGYDRLIAFATGVVFLYMIIIGVLAIDSFLNAVHDIYLTMEVSKEIPIKSFIQILKVVIYFVAIIFIISTILNKTPLYFFSGLGALTAVLLLIFKDAILGFVAGIQLAANKMVSHGDWIEMPKYGADGDVLEVALTTVKVQNWDKTVTTIPTYALISESFKNWRGMQLSGGRRIKRSVYIDINTIKFCTEEMIERFSKIRYIAEYMEKKKKELAEYNAAHQLDDSVPTNKRQLTNVGTFRAYVVSYLRNHPMINQEMTFLIRQLALAEHGLPIEIYVFCKDKVWAHYEAIQSDIFDHILSIVPEFDLKVFQNPAGSDFKEYASKRN